MAERNVAPYGSWKSPVTSDLIVAGSISLSGVMLDGEDVYWIETRPTEGGRNVVVQWTPEGRVVERTPLPFNARTRVHEYGGGSYAVRDGTLYFSNFADQGLYRQEPGAEPERLTSASGFRFADAIVDRLHGRLLCVREDHTSGQEAVNTLASVDLEGDEAGEVLVSGNDFYAAPRLSPERSRAAWLTWNHPNMPWDGTELWVAEVATDGTLHNAERVAGGVDESIFQPEWSPDGVLHFVSDRTGWWNLYRWREGEVEPLYEMEAEFGLPQWVFGLSAYDFAAANDIVCIYTRNGVDHLARLDTAAGTLEVIEVPYTTMRGIRVSAGKAVFLAGSPTTHWCVVRLDLTTGEQEVLRRASDLEIDEGYLSNPRAIEFPTEEGLTAHGFFYPPQNRDYAAPEGERPPLLVISHGGPTSATVSVLSLAIQFWTSRGFGVLDVNYGGSTGYGRAYRQRLNGQWGVVDVDDCVNGARYLTREGAVDGERLAIRGGSAGGYTTLCALTFRDFFHAGASHFGVSDAEALAEETHKFESRYLDQLIGPYPARRDLYYERSPINFTERLNRPTIFFQGLDDPVVPPNQAERMVEALREKGVPVAYVAFEGEQHGFRRAENIKRALDGELYFYSRIFGFELADPVEPVPIENLQSSTL
ncbi:MAG TPA: S9 family peptidase [Ardenticatenaceae bacterium]|jgi:dipeptidyl aminopeptidase/acylaminoacyl peptidase